MTNRETGSWQTSAKRFLSFRGRIGMTVKWYDGSRDPKPLILSLSKDAWVKLGLCPAGWFDRSDCIETLDLRSELTMSG